MPSYGRTTFLPSLGPQQLDCPPLPMSQGSLDTQDQGPLENVRFRQAADLPFNSTTHTPDRQGPALEIKACWPQPLYSHTKQLQFHPPRCFDSGRPRRDTARTPKSSGFAHSPNGSSKARVFERELSGQLWSLSRACVGTHAL